MRSKGVLIVIASLFLIALAFAAHTPSVTATASGNDNATGWTKAGSRELFNFSISGSGIVQANITVPGLNYTVETAAANNASWSCSGTAEKITCTGPAIVAGLNISFYATANASLATELMSIWNVTTTDSSESVSTLVYTGIDGTAPSINATSLVNGGNVSGLLNVTINATDAGSGINAAAFRFESSTGWINMSNLTGTFYYNTTFDTNNLADGFYNITVNVSDTTGNSRQLTINNTKINNTISHALVTTLDSIAYAGAPDNDWEFEFNVTMPNSCRLKVRLDNWTTASGNATYNLSAEGNAVWKYNSSGNIHAYNVKNSYDNSQPVYPANDMDGTSDGKMLAAFNLTMTVPAGTIGASSWKTVYYLKCQ